MTIMKPSRITGRGMHPVLAMIPKATFSTIKAAEGMFRADILGPWNHWQGLTCIAILNSKRAREREGKGRKGKESSRESEVGDDGGLVEHETRGANCEEDPAGDEEIDSMVL